MRRFDWVLLLSALATQACGGQTRPSTLPGPAAAAPMPDASVVQPLAGQQSAAAGKDGGASKPAPGAAPGQALSSQARIDNPGVSDADRKSLAKDNRAFAFALYGALSKHESGNLFFSPYSLSSALAMTYAGARAQTADQMQAVLHFELPGARLHAAFNAADRELSGARASADTSLPPPFTLDVANALWAQRDKKFLSEFLDTLAANYGAGVQLLDFVADPDAARQTINGWVADKTHDRIKDLLQAMDVTRDTVLVLTNAIYFKANWRFDFDAAATRDGTFHAASGEQTVKVMHRSLTTAYAHGDGYQAVVLPYAASSTELVLILPDSGKLADFEAKLDETLWTAIDTGASGYMVMLSLPRFGFEARLSVAPALDGLGMHDAFTTAADFSGMDGVHDLELSSVIHKAFIAVDEKGTEAAAATAVGVVATAAPAQMPAVELNVDRPFVFAIRDRTSGDVLFLGRVLSIAP